MFSFLVELLIQKDESENLGSQKIPTVHYWKEICASIILYLVLECVYEYFPLRQYKAHNPTAKVSKHSLQKTVKPFGTYFMLLLQ